MNAYQLVMIFYESLVPAKDPAAYQGWFDQADKLAQELQGFLPEEVQCRKVIAGAVLLAFPEQAMKKASVLEKELKPVIEKILGTAYTVRLYYSNFLIPEQNLEDMIRNAIAQYERQNETRGALVAMDLGAEIDREEELEESVDWAEILARDVSVGRFESSRLLFLQIMTLFRLRRWRYLTHTFLGLSMSALLILYGSLDRREADAIAERLTRAVIGPDWQAYVLSELEKICNKRSGHISRFDSFAHRVHTYIDPEVVNSKLDLKTAAESFGLTPTYFSQRFKEEMGVGFQAYIEQMRVRIGRDLLLQKDMSVTRVAKACGYDNVGTFRRNFKKHYGVNPGDIMQ